MASKSRGGGGRGGRTGGGTYGSNLNALWRGAGIPISGRASDLSIGQKRALQSFARQNGGSISFAGNEVRVSGRRGRYALSSNPRTDGLFDGLATALGL